MEIEAEATLWILKGDGGKELRELAKKAKFRGKIIEVSAEDAEVQQRLLPFLTIKMEATALGELAVYKFFEVACSETREPAISFLREALFSGQKTAKKNTRN